MYLLCWANAAVAEEFSFGAYTVQCCDSIEQVSASAWNANIANGHPYKGVPFLRTLESCFPDRKVVYLAIFKGDTAVGLSLATFEYFDLALGFKPWIFKLVSVMRRFWKHSLSIPMIMVGTYETAQAHWWYDPSSIDADQFSDILLAVIERRLPKAWLLLVRDFVDSSDENLRAALVRRRFKVIHNHPMAVIHLNGLTAEEHYKRLRARTRHTLRKLRAAPADQIQIEDYDCFEGILDACYELYLNVHNRAQDFQRPALPKIFLKLVGERPETRISVLRIPSGKIVAFVMTGFSGTVSSPYIIGMDYQQPRELLIYHHAVWHSVKCSAERGCKQIDLGLTGYFVKQGLGASLHPLAMFGRIQNPLLDRLLGARLTRTFSAPAPVERRLFREDA